MSFHAFGELPYEMAHEKRDVFTTFAQRRNSNGEDIPSVKQIRSESLLLNILPGEIAARLKSGEQEIADSFADVTVLFGDLVGFTAMSSKTSAAEIVWVPAVLSLNVHALDPFDNTASAGSTAFGSLLVRNFASR